MDTSLEILEQIKTHTADAYDVVEAKGGTIPATKNLANLAAAVRSLRREDYGTLYYYSGVTAGWDVEFGDGCEPTIVNQETFDNFRSTYPSWDENMASFVYAGRSWQYEYSEGMLEIADADFESTTGIRPNRTEDRAFFAMTNSITVDTTSEVLAHSLASESSIASLSNSGGETTQFTVDGVSIYALQVKGFTWGTSDSSSYVPDYFLASCPNLVEMGSLPSWLTTIGDYFLSYCSSFNQPIDLSNVTSIGDNFLGSCSSFNQPLSLDSATTIGDTFLIYCVSFNQSIDLGSVTTIGDAFLQSCTSFNQSLDLSNVTTIGAGFLIGCQSFNQPLDLSNVTTIGSGFLDSCSSFNRPLSLGPVTTIGDDFLYYCTSFNQSLDLGNATTIGNNFLMGCSSFNQSLGTSSISVIGDEFLQGCSLFNQPLSLSNVTTIGNSFLRECTAFNQSLDISSATSIGTEFLYYCESFNQLLNLGSVTVIEDYFLQGCHAFNQALDFNNGTVIGNYVLSDCPAFNQPLDISPVTSIGTGFLFHCTTFNQNLTIPSTVVSIGGGLMNDCRAMVSTVTCEAPATVAETSNDTFSSVVNTAACYTTGITLVGTYASDWHTKFPDRNSYPYRKTIVSS